MDLQEPAFDLETLLLIADVLSGAAHADGIKVPSESLAIYRILRDLLGVQVLPDEAQTRLDDFDPDDFDLEDTLERLDLSKSSDRQTLFAMIAEVTEADTVLDLDESSYIQQVAEFIGATPDEYEDLTVEVLSISSLVEPPALPDEEE